MECPKDSMYSELVKTKFKRKLEISTDNQPNFVIKGKNWENINININTNQGREYLNNTISDEDSISSKNDYKMNFHMDQQIEFKDELENDKDNTGILKFNIGRWTSDEHLRFIEALFLYGNEWKKVQNHIKTRSSTQARSHAQKFFIHLRKKFFLEDEENNLNTINDKIFEWIKENINVDLIIKLSVEIEKNSFSRNSDANEIKPIEKIIQEGKDKLCKAIIGLICNSGKNKRKPSFDFMSQDNEDELSKLSNRTILSSNSYYNKFQNNYVTTTPTNSFTINSNISSMYASLNKNLNDNKNYNSNSNYNNINCDKELNKFDFPSNNNNNLFLSRNISPIAETMASPLEDGNKYNSNMSNLPNMNSYINIVTINMCGNGNGNINSDTGIRVIQEEEPTINSIVINNLSKIPETKMQNTKNTFNSDKHNKNEEDIFNLNFEEEIQEKEEKEEKEELDEQKIVLDFELDYLFNVDNFLN